MYNGIKFTEDSDIESIAETSFRILNDCGVSVEHEKLAKIICEYNPQKIRLSGGRIYLNTGFVRDWFMSFKNTGAIARKPEISASAEIYNGPYLDPYDGEFKEWDEERLLSYIKLAKKLPHIGSASMLGCPLSGLSPRKIPLVEKLYAFKYGMGGSASIWDISLCPAIYEIWEAYAEDRGTDIANVFYAAVYLVSPLKMGYIESEQVLWFRERGLKVGVGNLMTVGLSAPVTPAGSLALYIAEQLFLSVMHAALYGGKHFGLGCSIAVADMQTCAFQYGRPERLLMNNALSDIASYYNIPFGGGAGLSDAKVPSYEAGVQKVSAVIANIMKGRNGYIAAGLLSIDEVHSPVQMVLDNEATGYIKRICRGFDIGESELAFETIAACVKDNSLFIEQPHTVENARNCLWEPLIFSREAFSAWHKNGGKTDYERAREKAISVIESAVFEPLISEECEKRILKIIEG